MVRNGFASNGGMLMTFTGFTLDSVAFLRSLAANNDREWFEANRDLYESQLLEPARGLVVELGARLRDLAPRIRAEPRVNGSILRINRDTRFSRDKTPYKTHIDLWFWEGGGPSREHPGYFLRLTASELMLGAGRHAFDAPSLERYRAAVEDARMGVALDRALKKVRAAGPYVIGGRELKRAPAGFSAAGARAELLMHTGLWAELTLDHPRQLFGPGFADYCFERFREVRPLQDWLVAMSG